MALYINEQDFKKADQWLHSLRHDSERRLNYQRIVNALKNTSTNPKFSLFGLAPTEMTEFFMRLGFIWIILF